MKVVSVRCSSVLLLLLLASPSVISYSGSRSKPKLKCFDCDSISAPDGCSEFYVNAFKSNVHTFQWPWDVCKCCRKEVEAYNWTKRECARTFDRCASSDNVFICNDQEYCNTGNTPTITTTNVVQVISFVSAVILSVSHWKIFE